MLWIFSLGLCINVAAPGVQPEEKSIEKTLGQSTFNQSINHRVKRDGGVITGAVIGAIFTAANNAAAAHMGANYGSGDKGGCQWLGTSPFCVGGCPPHHGYTEMRRSRIGPFMGRLNGRFFGEICLSGSKSLCCRSMANNNVWDGQWENHYANEKMRCVAYQANNACGAKLECYSDHSRSTSTFQIVGSQCNMLEDHFRGCNGYATYGLIILGSHDGGCGSIHRELHFFKIE